MPERFDSAAAFLPDSLRISALSLPENTRGAAEEIRLRCSHSPGVVCGGEERSFAAYKVRQRDLDMLLETATRASAHTALEGVRSGFITLAGGHRLGLCGSAVIKDGTVINYRALSSVNLRIAREIKGLAKALLPELYPEGKVRSTLIISPPGAGKTTLLRDLIRCVSDGVGSVGAHRVSVVDERGEIAAMLAGEAQLYVGQHTDVLTGCMKAEGIMALLRAMNPQVIALDEISSPQDAQAALAASNCGVRLFATAHAESLRDLAARPSYRQLEGLFERVVVIECKNGERRYTVSEVRDA